MGSDEGGNDDEPDDLDEDTTGLEGMDADGGSSSKTKSTKQMLEYAMNMEDGGDMLGDRKSSELHSGVEQNLAQVMEDGQDFKTPKLPEMQGTKQNPICTQDTEVDWLIEQTSKKSKWEEFRKTVRKEKFEDSCANPLKRDGR
jgi:hypothetical protein